MSNEIIYYSVYRITNLILKKHYYGYKTSSVHPKQIVGVSYFSSLSGQEGIDFRNDQIENPQNYRYKIVGIFNNKTDAINLEIRLHNKFDVGVNQSFYNKAKQKSVGFDTTGTKINKNIIAKRTESLRLKRADPNYVDPRIGRKRSPESVANQKATIKKKIASGEWILHGVGKSQSQESIEKFKQSLKATINAPGYVHPNKNRKRSKESIAKQKATVLKNHQEPSYVPVNLGRKHTQEHIDKVVTNRLKITRAPDYNNPLIGRTQTKEHIDLAKTARAAVLSAPGYVNPKKGKKLSDEDRAAFQAKRQNTARLKNQFKEYIFLLAVYIKILYCSGTSNI